jgi:hypothetical protein
VEDNKIQVVEPEVTRAKFEHEIAEFILIEDEWRKKGIVCLKRDCPNAQFVFIAHHIKPVIVAFAVSIDFTNYDIDPPSVVFINPFTLQPVKTRDLQVGFFQVSTQIQQVPGSNGMQEMQLRVPVSILVPGLDDIPFLCIPGIREYHNHPAHSNNSWLNYRTKGEGKLSFILDQLYIHCIPHIVGFNAHINFSPKQF